MQPQPTLLEAARTGGINGHQSHRAGTVVWLTPLHIVRL